MEQAVYGPRRGKRRLLVGLLVVLLVLACGTSALLFFKYQRAIDTNTNKEADAIAKRIGDIVSLPSEKPSISTVLDRSKLTNKVLKERAHNGDKLLIYDKAKRIILYRPSVGKVIDMLTIEPAAPVPPTVQTEPTRTEYTQ